MAAGLRFSPTSQGSGTDIRIASPGIGTSIVLQTLLLIAGMLLLILAVRNFLKEDDPDTVPPKFMTL
jgi:hypothetical protein